MSIKLTKTIVMLPHKTVTFPSCIAWKKVLYYPLQYRNAVRTGALRHKMAHVSAHASIRIRKG